MMLNLNKSLNIAIMAFALLITSSAFALTVKDIKGQKLLIEFENENLAVGDIVVTMNSTPEAAEVSGSAKVLQIREKLAVAAISDGKFTIGQKLTRKITEIIEEEIQSKSTETEAEYVDDEEIYETAEQRQVRLQSLSQENIIFRKDMLKVSLIGSVTKDEISAKQADDTLPFAIEETVPMKGTGSGLGIAFDYPSRWGVTLRTVFLSEKLAVSGLSKNPNMCNGKTSQNCLVNVNYLSLGGHLRFDYNIKRFTLWLAGGAVFKNPTARETTALRQVDLKLANALVASTGLDVAFNNRYFIPIAAEYHYSLNKSDSVPIIDHSSILLGFGVKF